MPFNSSSVFELKIEGTSKEMYSFSYSFAHTKTLSDDSSKTTDKKVTMIFFIFYFLRFLYLKRRKSLCFILLYTFTRGTFENSFFILP